jgi:signal transduction histidine kinase/CheY-like chemotaxis protein
MGPRFPVELRISSVRDGDGRPAYRVVSVIDITARRRAEEELRQIHRMEAIGRVSGGMAHDFNNLLGVIIGNLELCLYSGEVGRNTREFVTEALQAAQGGAEVIARLLAFSRRQSLRAVLVQPNRQLDGLRGLLARVLGEAIGVTLDLAADLWPVLVDPAQLEQGIMNMVTNARDAMPRGSRLTIATANWHLDAAASAPHPDLAPGDYVTITVTDTGVGMAPDVAMRVFEPYFTTKEMSRGTGLGLSTLFGFARQSGGTVTVDSAPGQGATFRLYLPRAPAATERAAPAAAPAAAAAAAAGTPNDAVLLVEDNPSLRRVAARMLAELGYAVIEADGPPAALAVLAERRVRLVFSDVAAAGPVDGAELARQARERWPGTAVLLASGDAEHFQEARSRALAGHIALLKKPYSLAELAAAIEAAIHASSGLR